MQIIKKYRFNRDPRLSSNQMAEYLSATPLRRRAILREAKYPATVMVIRYQDAYGPIIGYLTGSGEALSDGVLGLRRRAEEEDLTDFLRDNCSLCIDAIQSFQSTLANLDAGKIIFRRPSRSDTKLLISGVNISVSIDAITEEPDKHGEKSTGAAILIFSKSKNEADMASRCKAVALLVYQMLKSDSKIGPTCVPELCMAIDVFNARIYRAGTGQKRLWKTVEISCDEVNAMWPTIKPPADYNGPPLPKVA
jgi:hypothetical protein